MSILNERRILDILIEEGLLDKFRLVTKPVTCTTISYRNMSFIVSQGSNTYFVKCGVTTETKLSVENEANFYHLVQSESFSKVRSFLPKFICFIPCHCILVLEFVKTNTAFSTNSIRKHYLSGQVCSQLGVAIGSLHSISSSLSNEGNINASIFDSSSYLQENLLSLTPSAFAHISAGNIELIRIVQEFGEFHDFIATPLSASIEKPSKVLTHNDLKLANILTRRRRLLVVDWELAAYGSSEWDIGSILADFLVRRIESMPLGGGFKVSSMLKAAAISREDVKTSANAFWIGYKECIDDSQNAHRLRLHSVQQISRRLFQTVYESAQTKANLNAFEIYLLQIAMNIYSRPEEAAVRLFGFDLNE